VAAHEELPNTVVVAVGSDAVREALVAMLSASEGFRIVAETNNADAALEAARRQRPRLVLIDPELSNCGGWRVIQQIRREQLACVVVALGRHANGMAARLAGAQSYVQMGIAPRDLLSAIEAAMALSPSGARDYRRPDTAHASSGLLPPVSSAAEAEDHLLPDTHAVLDKPTLVDF
jgi:DNA-binding NarL/FixJ family response regulator